MPHPTPSPRRGLVVAACLAGVALAGCSSAPSGIVATYDAQDAGATDAVLSGTLSITSDCVTVRSDSGVMTPAFAKKPAVSGKVLRFHGAEYPDGAKIELSGGETKDPSKASVPKGCPTDHVFLVDAD